MRIALAACVAAVIAVGLLLMGCAGGISDDTGLVLRSVSLELAAPAQDTPESAEVGARWTVKSVPFRYATGTSFNCAVKPRKSAGTQWDATMDLNFVANPLWVGGNNNQIVWVGNDAWGYYGGTGLDGDSNPFEGGDWTTADGLVFYTFLLNQSYPKTMVAPWLELNYVTGPFKPEGFTAPGGNLRTLPGYNRASGMAHLWEMAKWQNTAGTTNDQLAVGAGGPGSATYPSGYLASSHDACDTASFEEPLFFRLQTTPNQSNWTAALYGDDDNAGFSAGVTIYWYEQP